MAGNFSGACRRVLRRAIAVSTGTFFLAITAGIVAWFGAAPQSLPAASQLAAVFTSPAELRSGEALLSEGDGSRPMVLAVSGGTLQAAQAALDAEVEPEPTPEAISATLAVVEQPAPPAPAPPAAPPPERPTLEELTAGQQVAATVSYYYCQQGSNPRGIGDGGGFCGAMRDGTVVYPGAAACAHAYLGQHFRIVGDPLERVYTCADTGSAVHGQHRDIWFMNSDDGMNWQAVVGRNITIEILE